MTLLYLVRHGQTEWSRTGRHTSVTELDLTETGVAQARELDVRLDRADFGANPVADVRDAAPT